MQRREAHELRRQRTQQKEEEKQRRRNAAGDFDENWSNFMENHFFLISKSSRIIYKLALFHSYVQ